MLTAEVPAFFCCLALLPCFAALLCCLALLPCSPTSVGLTAICRYFSVVDETLLE